ncbi:MAG TPA: beta-ketoacyl-ACP synthase III [Planctomycetota bacterium]|jgi:3-oxoacyl-[acyl-carrier-protein] synthase-3|nr:3-oxoacyl-ACP synthase [Planctomycetota bacterium]MDP7245159.1 beta-ketoacyl-ACP synthase III [Planctomycetota bacterium]MDP7560436.1 beta-ketoacyl-ACP synthase III [Planctomycetota bacterium]HJM39656.1 beta-ketoacyl-ACP synthase III [Planctomycetota bacterium]|tara:strand:+ start:14036 stop:15040 length:1005 start_codon:yes stop_codon:yes gene_type:complete
MNFDHIGLLGIGSYVPERVMTNADWSELVDTTDEWIIERTGIRERRYSSDDQTTTDFGEYAGKAALADAGLEAVDIDELIIATDTPEMFFPDSASFIQHRLGMGEIPAYDLAGSGCAGFIQALDVARSRAACGDKKVLVMGIELASKFFDWEDRNTCILFGDGAGAAVVGPVEADAAANHPSILSLKTGTDGSRADILSRIAGGTRMPFSMDVAKKGLHKLTRMDGREIFKEAVKHMCAASTEVMEMAGVSSEEVKLFVPHQANMRIIHSVAKHLGAPEEKVFINVDRYGNTGSASVPIALCEARDMGVVESGDLVLCTAFGAGFHWGAALLRL